MRQTFHDELAFVGDEVTEMTRLVEAAMRNATGALLSANRELAEAVIAGDSEIDALCRGNEERVIELVSRQQPVASDLRTLITALRVMATLERMGDLAAHVAEVARMRYPAQALPDELSDTFRDMGRTGCDMVRMCRELFTERDAGRAAEVRAMDHVMDAQHRRLFAVLFEGWSHGMQPAVDVLLLGRYYERYADHAVTFANRIVYLVTGEYPRNKK